MSSFERILADLDPRTDGQPALDRVRQIAADASVELFVCENLDHTGGGVLYDDEQMSQARDDYMSGIETWLGKRAGDLEGAGIDVTTRIAWHAPRYEAILEAAKTFGADLVIRSAREHSKLERLLISATDWELIRRAPQTVWLVKKRPRDTRSGVNVLASVDPVHAQEKKVGLDRRIMKTAADIAARNNGTLHVFHAWQPGAAIAPAVAAGPHVPMPVVRVDADLIESLREERAKMVDELAKHGNVADDHRHLREGTVTGELEDVIHEHDIDVVVAGGVSRGRLERLVIGSTAEAILESVDCDVVVVKPSGSGAD